MPPEDGQPLPGLTVAWDAPAAVGAFMSTRAGGVSRGPWASLNLGDAIGDDPVAVAENRRRFALAIGGRPCWLSQVHGRSVVDAGGAPPACADASFTAEREVFATLQYYFDEYGATGYDGYRAALESRWARVEYADIPIGLPVAEYQGAEYSAIVYGRGPLFFEALKQTMGNDAFDRFLREYVDSLSWGISMPETLKALAETNCACDLTLLFNEWVYRK